MATQFINPEVSQDSRDFIDVVTTDGRKTQVFVKSFSLTTIDQIKSILEWKFDCGKDQIKLYCGITRLEDDNKCLSDYNIRSKDKLNMSLLIRGGQIMTCTKIMFTDITHYVGEDGSAEGMSKRKISETGPRYHVVAKGLNFLAICNKSNCHSQRNIVVVRIGLKKEPIDFSYELEELQCPVCESAIPSSDCLGMGLHWCRAHVMFKTDAGKKGEYGLIAGDEFVQFVSTGMTDKIGYKYIRISTKPYSDIA